MLHVELDRVSPLAVPVLVIIGRERTSVGAADDQLLIERRRSRKRRCGWSETRRDALRPRASKFYRWNVPELTIVKACSCPSP
jgi:hypothetical protein